jgi:hypothetical protein
MPFQIAVQKDYFVTEASIELPANVAEVDEILKATGTTGKMVIQYNQGKHQGVNVEQRTRIPELLVEETRNLLGIGTKIL